MDIFIELIIENRIYRESIFNFLKNDTDIRDARLNYSAEEILKNLRVRQTDAVIIDSNTKDLMPLLYQLKRDFEHVKVILIVLDFKNSLITECAKIGVEGFITNEDGTEDLKNCIKTTFQGELYYPSRVTRLLLNQFHSPNNSTPSIRKRNLNLTYRQQSVVELVDQGLSNKQIARNLGIELATVKNHVHQIIEKLGASSRYEAAAIFRTMRSVEIKEDTRKPMITFPENNSVNDVTLEYNNVSLSN